MAQRSPWSRSRKAKLAGLLLLAIAGTGLIYLVIEGIRSSPRALMQRCVDWPIHHGEWELTRRSFAHFKSFPSDPHSLSSLDISEFRLVLRKDRTFEFAIPEAALRHLHLVVDAPFYEGRYYFQSNCNLCLGSSCEPNMMCGLVGMNTPCLVMTYGEADAADELVFIPRVP